MTAYVVQVGYGAVGEYHIDRVTVTADSHGMLEAEASRVARQAFGEHSYRVHSYSWQ